VRLIERRCSRSTATSLACPWCEKRFKPQRCGSPQVFCTAACRSAFHSASRRWAERALACGLLTIAELQNSDPQACTLRERTEEGSSLPEQGRETARPMLELSKTLKPRGVLFSSNPRGNNEEDFSDGRYACFFDLDTWRDYVTSAGFVELDHYYRPPGLPRERQPWLATVWRKA